MPDHLDNLADHLQNARQELAAVNGKVASLERQTEEAEANTDRMEREARADELLTGEKNVAVATEVEQLREQAESLESQVEDAEDRVEEAVAALADAVRTEYPDAIARRAEAVEEQRDALARIGATVLGTFPDLLDAEDTRQDADAELERLKRLLPDDAEDRSVRGAQLRRVRDALRDQTSDLTPEEVVGVVVRDVLQWLRRSDRLSEAFEARGIPPLSGSFVTTSPVPASEQLALRIERNSRIDL